MDCSILARGGKGLNDGEGILYLGPIGNQDPHHGSCLEYICESILDFAKEYLEEIPSLELKMFTKYLVSEALFGL